MNNNPWPYTGYTPCVFEDLFRIKSGAISVDGYIVTCYGNGHAHALAWNALPEDHSYRKWAKVRWITSFDYSQKLRDATNSNWREWNDFLAFERGVINGKFHYENGIRVVLFTDSIHIEGTRKGIEHQMPRIQDSMNDSLMEPQE